MKQFYSLRSVLSAGSLGIAHPLGVLILRFLRLEELFAYRLFVNFDTY